MSIKIQYSNIFDSRREKVINLLLSEIIFLKNSIHKSSHVKEKKFVQIELEKLENVLEIIKDTEKKISDKDFDKIIMIVYQTINEIVNVMEFVNENK